MFSFFISLVAMLAIPVSGGLPVLLTREVASYARAENWSAYRGLVATAHLWVLSMATIMSIGLLCWWFYSANAQTAAFLFVAMMLPLLGFDAIRNGVLKGLGHPALSEAPASLLHPALLVVGYLGLAAFELASVENAQWWYLAAMVMAVLVGIIFLLRARPADAGGVARNTEEIRRWRNGLLPLALIVATTTLAAQIVIVMLGVMGNHEAVAYLRVAQRAAELVVLPLLIMNSIIAPYFVNALQSGSRDELREVARHSARLTFAVSLPVAASLILFGSQILALTFGPSYAVSAYTPMLILISAQLLSASMGASAYLLAMSGNDRLSLLSQVLGLLSLFALTVLLVPQHSAIGAAYAVAAGILVPQFVNAVLIFRKLGIRTWIV